MEVAYIKKIVLQQLQRVLTTKLKVPEEDVAEVLQFLQKHHVEPMPEKPSKINVRDEDDRWVLESAIQAKADMLLTGDIDLLVIFGTISTPEIATPREFWELLKK